MHFNQTTRLSAIATTLLTVAALSSQAGAVTTTTVIDQPGNFSNGDEVPALADPTTGSIGSGSFSADPSLTGSDGQQHLIFVQGGMPGPLEGGQTSYSAPGANPRLLFPDSQDVTIGDLTSISFDTNTTGSPDWFVDIFAAADDGGFGGPNFDLTVDNADNSPSANGFTTHTLDADGGAVEQDLGGSFSNPMDLDTLQSDFGDEEILFVALGTGTNYDNFGGNIDNFVFEYDLNGDSFTRIIDFEAQQANVPTPATLPLIAVGLGVVALVGRRRRIYS